MKNIELLDYLSYLLFLIPAIAASVYFLVLFRVYLKKSKQLVHWPSVTGTVIKSLYESSLEVDTDYFSIKYEYNVSNKKYLSDRLFFSKHYYEPRDYRKKYPVGSSVIVYYNPNKPKESVLDNKSAMVYPFLYSSIFFAIISFIVICIFMYNYFIE